MESDEFKALTGPGEGTYKDKGSKFTGYAFPVKDEEEVKVYLEEIKSLHPKARHHCYAYRLGPKGEDYRANDDGEPSGSAGKPMLNCILSEELTDTLVIVVRYFGGTLLGVPGLINAYKNATQLALEEAEKEVFTINEIVKISYDFDQVQPVMQTIRKYDLKVLEQTYEDRNGILLEVRKTYVDKIKEDLEEFWTMEIVIVD